MPCTFPPPDAATTGPTPEAGGRRVVLASGLLLLLLTGGCASLPDLTLSYRPVAWKVAVAVSHTVTCSATEDLVLVDRGATVVPGYGADPQDTQTRYFLRIRDLDRFTADVDLKVGFTEDGRLKSINQFTLGQGEAVVKGVVSAGAALAALSPAAVTAAATLPTSADAQAGVFTLQDGLVKSAGRTKGDAKAICAVVRKWSRAPATQLAQVSLMQSGVIVQGISAPTTLETSSQQAIFSELAKAGLTLQASMTASLPTDGASMWQPIARPAATMGTGDVPLTLQQMGRLTVHLNDGHGALPERSVPVPLTSTFVLPIPKAALFGRQNFELALAESGAITSIGYGRTSGSPAALGALTAAATASTTRDNAEGAALKAASDLLAQQQRHAKCMLDPTKC